MAFKLLDNARMTVSAPGTGNFTFVSAPTGWQSFGAAGAVNGDVTPYRADDGGANWEQGLITFGAGATSASRTVTASSNGGSAVNFTGSVNVTAVARAVDVSPAGAAALLAGTAGKLVGCADVQSAIAYQALADAASITFNMANGNNGSVTLGGNRTLANITNPIPLFGFVVKVAASTSTRTLSLDTNYKVATGVESFPISISTTETVYLVGFVDTSTRFVITGVVRTT
jgi:hypothetical protein